MINDKQIMTLNDNQMVITLGNSINCVYNLTLLSHGMWTQLWAAQVKTRN